MKKFLSIIIGMFAFLFGKSFAFEKHASEQAREDLLTSNYGGKSNQQYFLYEGSTNEDLFDSVYGNPKLPVHQFNIRLLNSSNTALNVALFTGDLIEPRVATPSGIGAGNYAVFMQGGGYVTKTNSNNEVLFDDPTILNSYSGSTVDAIIGDGILNNGVIYKNGTGTLLSTTDSGYYISLLRKFVKTNKCLISKLLIDVNNREAYTDGSLVIQRFQPFNKTSAKTVRLSDFVDPKSLIDTRLTVDLLKQGWFLQLDENTLVTLNIPATAGGNAPNIKIQVNVEKIYSPIVQAYMAFAGLKSMYEGAVRKISGQ